MTHFIDTRNERSNPAAIKMIIGNMTNCFTFIKFDNLEVLNQFLQNYTDQKSTKMT